MAGVVVSRETAAGRDEGLGIELPGFAVAPKQKRPSPECIQVSIVVTAGGIAGLSTDSVY